MSTKSKTSWNVMTAKFALLTLALALLFGADESQGQPVESQEEFLPIRDDRSAEETTGSSFSSAFHELQRRHRDHFFRSLRSEDPSETSEYLRSLRLPQDHYFRSLRAPKDHFFRTMRRPQDHYFRSMRSPQDHYFRSMRSPQDHYFRSMRSPQDHYFRSLRAAKDHFFRTMKRSPQDHFFRSMRSPSTQDHYFRSMRVPTDHFFRSMRSPQDHYFRSMRVPTDHFFRSMRSPQDHYFRSLRSDSVAADHFFRSMRAESGEADEEGRNSNEEQENDGALVPVRRSTRSALSSGIASRAAQTRDHFFRSIKKKRSYPEHGENHEPNFGSRMARYPMQIPYADEVILDTHGNAFVADDDVFENKDDLKS